MVLYGGRCGDAVCGVVSCAGGIRIWCYESPNPCNVIVGMVYLPSILESWLRPVPGAAGIGDVEQMGSCLNLSPC